MSMRMSLSPSAKIGLFALVLAGIVAAWWFWPTETRRVAAAIKRLEQAVEAADADGIMRGVSKSFQHEGLDYAGLAVCAQWLTKQIGCCDVYILKKRITVQGNLAAVGLNVVVSATGSNTGFSGTDRSSWQVTFRKERGEWLVHKVTPVELRYGRASVSSLADLKRWMEQ